MKDIKKVTVLGSGVMGSGIAAHLANSGFEEIYLLDIIPPKLTEEQIQKGYTLEDKNIRNLLARKGLNAIIKSNPPQLGSQKLTKYITIGNTTDDFDKCVSESDWIIEVVPEIAKIKNDTFKRVDKARKQGSIVTSNTSGISIDKMINGCSEDLKQNFLVTHFFNPVRFMKLLEIVKTNATNPEVLDTMVKIGEEKLGKGIVYSYDVPAFVGNRIGGYFLMKLISMLDKYDIETLNNVFDPKLGYGGKPFSTCDLAGVDVVYHVMKNIYENTNDECHETFKVPEFMEQMVKKGLLGRKANQGFFKRDKVKGKKVDLVIDPNTCEYVPKKSPVIQSVIEAKRARTLEDSVKAMYHAKDLGGEIYRTIINEWIRYAFNRAPEISPEGIEGVDKAVRWGFNQKLGPGEIVDVIGGDEVIQNLEKEGELPPMLKEIKKQKWKKVYTRDEMGPDFVFGKNSYRKTIRPEKCSSFKDLAKTKNPIFNVKHGGRLFDINDGVLALEMLSKNGTVNMELMEAINKAIDTAENGYKGLVIGNDFENFSFGADLDMMLGFVLRGKTKVLERVIKDFQMLNQRIKFSKVPVVVVKKGMALGGGCEIGYGAHIRAAHDSFIGLVEFGVGLIPGGGGVKETLVKKYNKYADKPGSKPLDYIRETFEQIAYVKIAMSAHEAKELGYMSKDDGISMNADFLLHDAKQDLLKLSDNYQPPQETKVLLPGRDMKATLYTGIDLAVAGKQLPPMKVPGFI
ncbi:3-hydroxyacyl-CoA dehydrogenase, partial [Candidatus Woesearchaeota archaeon]|nr:3-hydroxyacyl-CoA dehydrogenase [Candidatus Woesearchaeota archaeon]